VIGNALVIKRNIKEIGFLRIVGPNTAAPEQVEEHDLGRKEGERERERESER
jgi:hypothetical protein